MLSIGPPPQIHRPAGAPFCYPVYPRVMCRSLITVYRVSRSLFFILVCEVLVKFRVPRSLFPFPAEPYADAVRAGKRVAHHLILYYSVRVDSSCE
jgi:hypothetical protein